MNKLPAPLPPEDRPVGQLVAETLRLYGRRFGPSLALGIAPAASGVVTASLPGRAQFVYALTIGNLVATCVYIAAVLVATDARLTGKAAATALLCGAIVWLPVPFLASLFLLPAAAWLALFGLVVPVAVVERTGVAESFRRALRLSRVDFVHALGSIATLALVGLLTALVLFFLLRGQGEATLAVAAFLSVLVIAPIIFLGSALLYVDQAARLAVVDSVPTRKPARRSA